MAALRRFVLRLLNVVRPGLAEEELARETAAHLALLEEDYRCRGMTADDARLAARRAFGGVEQTKDRQRDARSFVWLDDARRDLQYSARLLKRNPIPSPWPAPPRSSRSSGSRRAMCPHAAPRTSIRWSRSAASER
jgi:hypothetical protein